MNAPKIGQRVRFNDGVAFAYVGKAGTVIDTRNSSIYDSPVFVVKLDEPTACAPGWPVNETLGCPAYDLDPA